MKMEIKHRFTGSVIFACEADSMGIAVKRAIEAKANLSEANLSRADLFGADLSQANLSQANLSQANLSEANLSRADLFGANLSWANLSQADLLGAKLSGAILDYTNLLGAKLSGAILDYTNLPMWCGTLKGVKVDFRLVCQMLLHIFALECEDKRFKAVKKAIEKYARLSEKWSYYVEKHPEAK